METVQNHTYKFCMNYYLHINGYTCNDGMKL